MSKKPTVLMILDGYGLSDKTEGNAVKQAKTPVMDKLIAKYPFVQGEASGMAVGLPEELYTRCLLKFQSQFRMAISLRIKHLLPLWKTAKKMTVHFI